MIDMEDMILDVGSTLWGYGEEDDDRVITLDNDREHMVNEHPDEECIVADARYLPFKDGIFKGVWGVCIPYCEIDDEEDSKKVLREMMRVSSRKVVNVGYCGEKDGEGEIEKMVREHTPFDMMVVGLDEAIYLDKDEGEYKLDGGFKVVTEMR